MDYPKSERDKRKINFLKDSYYTHLYPEIKDKCGLSHTTDSDKMYLLEDQKHISDEKERENIRMGAKRVAPAWTQFEVLLWRNQCQVMRDMRGYILKFANAFFLGLLYVCVFWDLTENT